MHACGSGLPARAHDLGGSGTQVFLLLVSDRSYIVEGWGGRVQGAEGDGIGVDACSSGLLPPRCWLPLGCKI